MPEEMIVEWGAEADEADEAWEADEAFDEADDSVEDLGERTDQRRRGRYGRGRGRYRPGRGVRGMTMRDADGRARNVAFPARLATTAETNRGLASQDAARRALEARLERLEARNRQQGKNASSISGIVTLLLGGGLTAFSLFKANQDKGSGTLFNQWSDENTAEMATLTSVAQLATTGASMLVNGRYHHSGIGIAADAFAALQIAGFAVASIPSSRPLSKHTVVNGETEIKAAAASPGAADGDLLYDKGGGTGWYVLSRDFGATTLQAVPIPVNGPLNGAGGNREPRATPLSCAIGASCLDGARTRCVRGDRPMSTGP